MREPNFIIAGAARSGTTTLYHCLDLHPDIYLSKPLQPECKFFVYPEEHSRGKDYLLKSRYGDVKREKAVGEKTTHYMNCVGVPERISRLFPHMKFIFLLRDPVERALSNYWWSVKNGLENLPLEAAIFSEEERIRSYEGPWKVIQPYSYQSRGFYVCYLREYLKFFPRENLLVLITEKFFENPDRELGKVYDFLGVEPLLAGELPRIRQAERKEETPPEVLEHLKKTFLLPNRELENFLGEALDGWAAPRTASSPSKS